MIKSAELISKIKEFESPIIKLEQFFNDNEINLMLNWYEQCLSKNHEITTRLDDYQAKNNDITAHPAGDLKNEICSFLNEKLQPIINKSSKLNIEIDCAFHANKKPYGIHTDSGYDPNEFIYKQGIIPLVNKPLSKKTHTVILKQKCYHSSSFPNISADKVSQEMVEGLDFNHKINDCTYKKYWKNTDERKKQMFGFTIDYPFEWQVGNTVVWDRSHIHCSSDFEATGVEFKLGLMWISRIKQ